MSYKTRYAAAMRQRAAAAASTPAAAAARLRLQDALRRARAAEPCEDCADIRALIAKAKGNNE